MADAALAPSFPQDQFTLQKGRRMAQIGQEKAQPTSLATRLVPGLLYGQEHAYGKPASGTDAERRRHHAAKTWQRGTRPGSSPAARP